MSDSQGCQGNNLVEMNVEEQDIDEGIDLLNDNLEDLPPIVENNIEAIENNNPLRLEDAAARVEPEELYPLPHPPPLPPQDDAQNDEADDSENSVARASQEVLYDINSEQDLLEDFDIPPQPNENNLFDMMDLGNGVILVGIHGTSSSSVPPGERIPEAASIQTDAHSFPNWLLQILGPPMTQEPENSRGWMPDDAPHFYCQGDGLGVHPSVIAVEAEEADDGDNDTTEESSSNNTADFAEIDPGPSDMFDMSSLPEESPATSVVEDSASLRPVPGVSEEERWEAEESFCPSAEQQRINDIANGAIDDILVTAAEEIQRISQHNLTEKSEESASSSGYGTAKTLNNPKSTRRSCSESDEELCTTPNRSGTDISLGPQNEIEQPSDSGCSEDVSRKEPQEKKCATPLTDDVAGGLSVPIVAHRSEYFDARTEEVVED